MAFSQAPAARPRAQQGGPAMRMVLGGAMPQWVLRQLNLTDSQKQQAQAIFQNARQSSQPLQAQMKPNRQALTAAVKQNNGPQIQQLSVTIGNLQGPLLSIRSEAMATFYALLTPDQQAKVDQAQQRFGQGWRPQQGQQGQPGQQVQ
jgi:Spy/CpxP family protein refolding chaperone